MNNPIDKPEKIYTIYKATNILNGKCYVGFDSNWPKRKKCHKSRADIANNQYFHKSLKKHGFDNFVWEVLYQGTDKDYTLNVMEPKLIAENESHFTLNGYNLTYGGEGTLGRIVSEETKRKLSQSGKGKVISPEAKQKMSLAKKGKPSPNKGKTFSEEHRLKLSLAKLGKSRDNETKNKISSKLKGRVSPNKGKFKRKSNE